MGERLVLRLYKGGDEAAFRRGFEMAVRSRGGRISWDENFDDPATDCRTSHNGPVHVVYLPYRSGGADYYICEELGKLLECPWMELRVQEGTLWDFSLVRDGKCIDNFSTLPQVWDDDPVQWEKAKGNPDLLASAWGLPRQSIERYMMNWGMKDLPNGTFDTLLTGTAYPGDEHEYGDIWQVFDFLRALGGKDPMNTTADGKRHRLDLPKGQ